MDHRGALWVLSGACAALALLGILVRVRRRARIRRYFAAVDGITRRYLDRLSIRQRQLVRRDDYGNDDVEGWSAHIDYFVDRVVRRDLAPTGHDPARLAAGSDLRAAVHRRIDAYVRAHQERQRSVDLGTVASGRDYEALCQAELERAGWVVRTTAATGDQGADLLAERDGRRVIIQCKFSGRPVGNKAVQEAIAGLGFYEGDRAAVVSDAPFTRSARQLAQASHVLLLHHDDLKQLSTLV